MPVPFARISFLCAALLVAASACREGTGGGGDTPPPPACGPDNCEGCCTGSGECVGGDEVERCGSAGGACVDCSAEGLCTAERACGVSPDRGESCAAPVPLTLVNGAATIGGTFAGRADDGRFSCGGTGEDLVFRLVTTKKGTLHVRLVQEELAATPLVAVRSACEDGASEIANACDTGGFSYPASLELRDLEPGTYFVWIDSGAAHVGAYTLEVLLSTGEGDTCDAPWPLPLQNGAARVTGGFIGAKPHSALTCNSVNGADVFYGIDVPRRMNVIASAKGSETNNGPSLQLARNCNSQPLLCTEADWNGTAEVRRTVEAGPHLLALETAYAAQEGTPNDFTLDVRLADPPANDACAGAEALNVSTGRALVTSTTRDAAHDDSSCDDAGADVFFQFTLTSTMDAEIDVKSLDSSAHSVALLSAGCAARLGNCAASNGTSAHLTARGLAAGAYVVVVSAAPGKAGRFTLEVTTGVRPVNGEACAGATPLTFTNGANGKRTASVNEDINRFIKDDPLDCSDGWNINHDVSYAFTLTEPMNAYINAQWTGGAGNILYLRVLHADCDKSRSLACESESMDRMDPVRLGSLPAGEYRIVVSGSLYPEGAPATFRLDVELSPPVTGEGCANPNELTFGSEGGEVSVSGDTTDFIPDNPYKCGAQWASTAGNDAVYAFTTTKPMNLQATLTTTDSQFRSALILRREADCAGGEEVVCDLDGGSWDAEKKTEIKKNALPPGRYVIVVDAAPRSGYLSDKKGGPFNLVVKLAPTLAGETCDNPLPLVFSNGAAGGSATASGTTVGMLSDTAICVGSGPDVVYTFTTDRELDFRATVTTTSGPRAKVWLSSGSCSDARDATCSYDNATTGPHTLSVGSLPAGTYKLVVDSDNNYGGSVWSLAASLTAHQNGETCANPLPLAFSNGAAGGTATVTGDLGTFFHQSTPCGDSDADAVYRFTTDRVLNLTAKVEPNGGTFQGALSLVRDCASIDWNQCSASSLLNKPTISAGSLPAGTWLLVVDGKGPYKVTATAAVPVAGDSCTNPLPLFAAGQSTTTKRVDVTGLFDDTKPSCVGYASAGQQDAFYSFTTSATMTLRATATTTQQYAYGPNLYVMPAGCATGAAGLCTPAASGRTTTLEIASLPPGNWVLVLDTQGDYDMYRGPFDLTVTVAPPQPGESCDNAIALSIPAAGGETTVSGDTTDFFTNIDAFCGEGQKTPGHDIVYKLVTTAPMNLRTLVKAKTAGFKPSVYHASASSCEYDSRLCGHVPSFTDWEMADWAAMPAGTHYLVVDSSKGAGAYDLTVRLMPIAQGESCASPLPLTLANGAAQVTGDIRNWFPDSAPNSSGTCSSMTSGEDAVWSFSTTGTRYVRAKVTTPAPEAEFAPTVYLRSGTCTGTEKDCDRGVGEAVIATSVGSGNHFLFLDSGLRLHSRGAYTLDVFVGDPPQGDSCANAIALSIPASGGTAKVTGDTSTFLPDITPKCGNSYGAPSPLGRDVVYSFRIDRTLKLTAKLDASGSFDSVLSLRSSCSGAESECKGGIGPYSPGTIGPTSLAAGTYYLVVDNGQNSNGRSYTLDVTLAP